MTTQNWNRGILICAFASLFVAFPLPLSVRAPLGGHGSSQPIGLISAPESATGYEAWLRYRLIDEATRKWLYDRLPAVVATADGSIVVQQARDELVRGVRGMLGRT